MHIATLAETDWLMFLGRLHPLFVHLPIGMVAAVVLAEMVAFVKGAEKVSSTRKLLLWATALSACASATAGWFLAQEGGYAANLLFWHRWLGIAMAGVLVLGALIALTTKWKSVMVRLLVLGPVIGLMTVTGHMGGTMTHGETYLSRYAPPIVARLLGPAPDESMEVSVGEHEATSDAQIVLALLRDRCYECHGSTKQKGKLRLDTPVDVATVVLGGDAAGSELFRRISLAHDDFDIMPPEGEPLTDDEVLAVMRWIRDGAEFAPLPEVLDEILPESLPLDEGALEDEVPIEDVSVEDAPAEDADGGD